MKVEKYLQEVAKVMARVIIARKVGGKCRDLPAHCKRPEEKTGILSYDGWFGILIKQEDFNIFPKENLLVFEKDPVDSDWRSSEKFNLTGTKKEIFYLEEDEFLSGALKKKNATLAELVSEAERKIWINEKYLKYFDRHADFYQKCDGSMICISDATCHGVPVLTAVVMPVRYSE